MSDFAAGLQISRAAASELVARLLEKGVIHRETDPDDRRVVCVRIAGRAEVYAGEMHEQWRRHLGAVFERFPDIDPDRLTAFLQALIDQFKGRTDA
jgi:DNA-binding MarR family transcriptional regulator